MRKGKAMGSGKPRARDCARPICDGEQRQDGIHEQAAAAMRVIVVFGGNEAATPDKWTMGTVSASPMDAHS